MKKRRRRSLAVRSRNRAWKALSKRLREEAGRCAWCGDEAELCVHHVLEKRLWPRFWLEEKNLITLCRKCHFKVHHHQAAEFFAWLAEAKPEQWAWIREQCEAWAGRA